MIKILVCNFGLFITVIVTHHPLFIPLHVAATLICVAYTWLVVKIPLRVLTFLSSTHALLFYNTELCIMLAQS